MLGAKQALEIGLVDELISPSELIEFINGEKEIPVKSTIQLSKNWKDIDALFSNNSYKTIMSGKSANGEIEASVVNKLAKTLSFKAPIAMDFAEELIEMAQGPISELEKLVDIFKTKDALLGLSSIGKRVEYSGE